MDGIEGPAGALSTLELKQELKEGRKLPLAYLADLIRSQLRKNYDFVVAITGSEGEGKSSLAIKLGLMIQEGSDQANSRLQDEQFMRKFIMDSVILSPDYENVIDKINNLPRYAPVILDEAMKSCYKRNFQAKGQRFLNQTFAICRKKNKAILMCIPNFNDLDKYYRAHRVKIWIHVVERGYGVIMNKDWSPFTGDPWNRFWNYKAMSTIFMRRKANTIGINDKMYALGKVNNVISSFRFKALPENIEAIYNEQLQSARFDPEVEELNKHEAVYKEISANAVRYLRDIRKMSYEDAAQVLKSNKATLWKLVQHPD